MVVMLTSFKRTYARGSHNCCSQCPYPTAGHYEHMPLPETPRVSQAIWDQSLLVSLFLSPGSWCTQGFVCALQESVSPVLWKFCNQIPLASKVKFSGIILSAPLFPAPLLLWASQLALVVKKPTCQWKSHRSRRFDPWVGKIPWRKKWLPTPVFLPG